MSLDSAKITVTKNKELIIFNYEKLESIDEKKIVTDKYDILGENLKISELDGYQIKILGFIKEIIFKYE